MSTAIKVKANRRNSLASTGPTSDGGKAIVADNALRHGLLSWKPVVTEFESEQEWNAHHEQTLLDLRPVGHLEALLAERVALLSWRLARVARFELEAISTAVEDVEGAWNSAHARSQSPLTKLAEKMKEVRCKVALLKQLPKAVDEKRLDAVLVAAIIDAAAKATGVNIYDYGSNDGRPEVQFPDYPDGAELDEVDWTAGRVRGAFDAIAKGAEWSFDSLRNGLIADMKSDLDEKTEQHRAHQADFERFRRRMLLPDEPTMERVRRYETTFERAMLRCLHELQRLQAARRGQAVPAPIAVDVSLSGDGE